MKVRTYSNSLKFLRSPKRNSKLRQKHQNPEISAKIQEEDRDKEVEEKIQTNQSQRYNSNNNNNQSLIPWGRVNYMNKVTPLISIPKSKVSKIIYSYSKFALILFASYHPFLCHKPSQATRRNHPYAAEKSLLGPKQRDQEKREKWRNDSMRWKRDPKQV